MSTAITEEEQEGFMVPMIPGASEGGFNLSDRRTYQTTCSIGGTGSFGSDSRWSCCNLSST